MFRTVNKMSTEAFFLALILVCPTAYNHVWCCLMWTPKKYLSKKWFLSKNIVWTWNMFLSGINLELETMADGEWWFAKQCAFYFICLLDF